MEIQNMINYNLFKGLAVHGCKDFLPPELQGQLTVEERSRRRRQADCLCLRPSAGMGAERIKFPGADFFESRSRPPKSRELKYWKPKSWEPRICLEDMYREFQESGDLDGVFRRAAERLAASRTESQDRHAVELRCRGGLRRNFSWNSACFLHLALAHRRKIVDNKS